MQLLKGRALSVILTILIGLVFLVCAVAAVIFSHAHDKAYYFMPNMFLDGEYSVDGGAWKTIDSYHPIRENFETITFQGKLTKRAEFETNIQIFTKNVWFTLTTEDGTVVKKHVPETLDEAYQTYTTHFPTPPDEEMKMLWYSTMQRYKPLQYRLIQTPGYEYAQISIEDLDFEKTYIFEVVDPYPASRTSLSDCFTVVIGDDHGEYAAIFNDVIWKIALFALICVFGMFLFPAAGFLSGKVEHTYLSFGFLCFFWGIYMAIEVMGAYLNLWIVDNVLCMTISTLSAYCFMTMLLLYFRTNMTRPFTRTISGAMAALYFAGMIVVTVLHLTGGADLKQTSPVMAMLSGLCLLETAAMLTIEIRQSHNRGALDFLISWVPLVVSLLLDICFSLILHSTTHIFMYGFAMTMLLQLVRFVVDIRKQYREAIEYQKVQKELYEAKVAVMVSQIRPHFMYNALSSIAMLCKLDPDRAYTATITFSDYLRGNMDSLKQTAPVPFSKELEHLKKYLYIEKMRFDDMLNIEYDIQTEDFEVPLLSVQPLVENAVKHGVGMKEDGGTVTIATRETETTYEVIISDDGVGFDTSAPKKEDGRSHVGMENTRRRLKDMCDADIVIESTPGEGTTAKIIIPKKPKEEPKP